MADSCVEGHRKKAKYLLDDDELGKPESTLHQELLLIPSFPHEKRHCDGVKRLPGHSLMKKWNKTLFSPIRWI